jgi:hypothetical protein
MKSNQIVHLTRKNPGLNPSRPSSAPLFVRRAGDQHVNHMKTETIAILTITIVSFVFGSTVFGQSVPDCSLRNRRVERDIKTFTRQLQGQEYCQFRRYDAIDDLDGDGKEDFIVIFTVEGVHRSMNHFLQFMSVYPSSQPSQRPLSVQVGERGKRSVDGIIRVCKSQLTTKDSIWQEGDALCCPSGHGESVFEIEKGKIKKTQEKGGLTN